MAFILFGKILLADSSAQELARVREKLDAAAIPYSVRTTRVKPQTRRGNAQATASGGMVMSPVAMLRASGQQAGPQYQSLVYIVKVSKRDYEEALKAVRRG